MPDKTAPSQTAPPGKLARQRHQWHLLYYVLAAFNILTVGFTLRLNHQMQEAFSRSVEVSSAWERRLKDYGDLINTAQAVQARCNNVFITRDVERSESDGGDFSIERASKSQKSICHPCRSDRF